jgi:hypothetical protein
MTETKPKRTTKSATPTEAPAKVEKKTASKTAATRAPAVKKAPAKAAEAPKAKPVAKKEPVAKKKQAIDADFRMRLITDTAYYIAEKRCSIATPEDDWIFSELLVDSIAFAVNK